MLRRSAGGLLASLGRQLVQHSLEAGSTAARQQPGSGSSSTSLLPSAARWFASQQAATAAGASACAGEGAAAAAAAPLSRMRQAKRLWQNYKKLSKFRLSLLVVATSSAGYAAGSRDKIDWAGLGWTSLGTFLCSASANALNQVGGSSLF